MGPRSPRSGTQSVQRCGLHRGPIGRGTLVVHLVDQAVQDRRRAQPARAASSPNCSRWSRSMPDKSRGRDGSVRRGSPPISRRRTARRSDGDRWNESAAVHHGRWPRRPMHDKRRPACPPDSGVHQGGVRRLGDGRGVDVPRCCHLHQHPHVGRGRCGMRRRLWRAQSRPQERAQRRLSANLTPSRVRRSRRSPVAAQDGIAARPAATWRSAPPQRRPWRTRRRAWRARLCRSCRRYVPKAFRAGQPATWASVS